MKNSLNPSCYHIQDAVWDGAYVCVCGHLEFVYLTTKLSHKQQIVLYLQTAFLWLESLLGIIFTPLDFSSIAFFTKQMKEDGSDLIVKPTLSNIQ